LFRAEVLSGFSDTSLEQRFQEIPAADYRELAEDASAFLDGVRQTPAQPVDESVRRQEEQRLRRRWEAIRRRDHFRAEAGEEVAALMKEIERVLRRPPAATGTPASEHAFSAQTWATRRNVKIDRIGSAWLIRRFIDPAARFRFVDEPHEPGPHEVRFDMFEAEFTHRGSRCTFEVLIEEFALRDPALAVIAEIVHEIDLKDDLYSRPEASGIGLVIDGLVLREPDDARRIEDGAAIFDGLLERIRRNDP
jgi:hypothetical protein